MAAAFIAKSEECIKLREEIERMQAGQDELEHLRKRHQVIIMENAQLKEEVQLVKRRQGGEAAVLKANLQNLDKRDEEQTLSVYKLKAENQGLQERFADIDKKHKDLLKSNSHTLSLLDQLKNKFNMQKDLN